jgi:hypothetical protein
LVIDLDLVRFGDENDIHEKHLNKNARINQENYGKEP